MNIAYKLADIISKPEPFTGRFVDIGPECFACVEYHGKTVISWKGENYELQKPTLRVRLHNWLIWVGDRAAQPAKETP